MKNMKMKIGRKLASAVLLVAAIVAAITAGGANIAAANNSFFVPVKNIFNAKGVVDLRINIKGVWEAELFSVHQEGGKQILTPPSAALTYIIDKNEPYIDEQEFWGPVTLRAITKIPQSDTERFYRLVIRTSPAGEKQPKNVISLPIIQLPIDPHQSYSCTATGIKNTGNVHIKAVSKEGGPSYILPGAEMAVPSGAVDEDGKVLCPATAK